MSRFFHKEHIKDFAIISRKGVVNWTFIIWKKFMHERGFIFFLSFGDWSCLGDDFFLLLFWDFSLRCLLFLRNRLICLFLLLGCGCILGLKNFFSLLDHFFGLLFIFLFLVVINLHLDLLCWFVLNVYFNLSIRQKVFNGLGILDG